MCAHEMQTGAFEMHTKMSTRERADRCMRASNRLNLIGIQKWFLLTVIYIDSIVFVD